MERQQRYQSRVQPSPNSRQLTTMNRSVSQTVPTVIFASAFREAAEQHQQPITDSIHDNSSNPDAAGAAAGLESIHITGIDNNCETKEPSRSESPGFDHPHFHDEDETEAVEIHLDGMDADSAAVVSAIHTNTHTSTNPSANHSREHSIIDPELIAARAASAKERQNQCKVVGCTETATHVGWCQHHHAIFTGTIADCGKSGDKKKASLRDRSSTMPSAIANSVSASGSSGNGSIDSTPSQSIASTPTRSKLSRTEKRSNLFDASCLSDASTESPLKPHQAPVDQLSFETRKAWREAHKVVYKDLPRLAKRMSVIDDKEVCVLWGRIANEEKFERATKPRTNNADTENLANGQDHGRDNETHDTDTGTESMTNSQPPQTSAQTLPLPVSPKSRVNSRVVDENELEEISTWAAVTNCVMAVANHLEDSDTIARAAAAFHRVSLTLAPASDLESLIGEIFASDVGEDTATFAVFRACHQSILFPSIYALKTNVYTSVGDLKDVRRHDGWTIEIYIGEGRVQVLHTRCEQSLHPVSDPSHFEVLWNLCCNFDRQMKQLTAAFLRIQDLSFHPAMPKQRKDFIVERLRGYGLLV